MTNREEIERRRTFAIISHPDAGKTTLTEKLLLYGGAINQAGSVKGKQSARHAVSDWMDIEKQRGISVTSSVLQFDYAGKCVNILDTPGHQDFSEDTYRTLMAADSAVMVIDAAKGVEAQTIKLFKVCTLRHIPIFTFINKMDREARDPFELMENIEEILGIKTYPMNWPIGCGKDFKGVFDRMARKVLAFSSDGRANGVRKVDEIQLELGDPGLDEMLTPYLHRQLVDEIELLDGAAEEFDLDKVLKGELSPVFFGSALTNFGVEPFLQEFLRLTPTPLARVDSLTGEAVDPCRDEFSGFIFKIQANMNKAHRDRIAFMRICSGKFERGMEAYHVQEGKNIKLATGTQLMAQDRAIVDQAYAGDIIGLFDPGIFSIGDTLCTGKKKVQFAGIPTFAPEHFARIEQKDTMKRKQPEHRVQRGDPDAASALRADPLDPERPRHLHPARPGPDQRHQGRGGHAGQPPAAVHLGLGRPLGPGPQRRAAPERVRQSGILTHIRKTKRAAAHKTQRPVLLFCPGAAAYLPKYWAISFMRSDWRTRKGQRPSQWPQDTQSEACLSSFW